jgi:hypothetical protein
VINNHLGYVFNFPIRMGGFTLMFIGIVVTIGMGFYIVAGVLLIAAGAFFAFTSSGIDIDLHAKAVRHYTRYFGLKFGRWNEYPTYPNICIISKERRQQRFREQNALQAENPYQYEIYLVSRSHRGKVLLQRIFDKEKAKQVANRLAGEMSLELVEYNPPGRKKRHRQHGDHDSTNRNHSKD